MIYVEMAGRCGNQLFHYACARAVQEKTQEELVFNFNKVFEQDPNDGYYNCLDDYKVVPYTIYDKKGIVLKNETSIMQKALIGFKSLHNFSMRNKGRKERADAAGFMQKALNHAGIYWIREGVHKIAVKSSSGKGNLIVSGICEAPEVFEDIADLLREELQPKEKPCEDVLEILNQMQNTNSVCINVRRGDFLSDANSKSFHVCTLQYYEKAIKLMRKKLDNPIFFIVSDDIGWCKEHIKGEDIQYTPDYLPVYEALRLIYTCKHFIISNSTFSWWGWFLSPNVDKIVISPSRWNNDGYHSLLIQKDWILIDP